MEIVLIAAVARNGVIGNNGEMPWYYPEDLKHFKRITMGSPVIAGRKTHESIIERLGHPLPGRTSIVLTRTGVPDHEDVIEVDSVEAALTAAEQTMCEEVFVIGGATVYEQFLPEADTMILTEINEEYTGDTYFPEWNANEWTQTDSDAREDLTFTTYMQKNTGE